MIMSYDLVTPVIVDCARLRTIVYIAFLNDDVNRSVFQV